MGSYSLPRPANWQRQAGGESRQFHSLFGGVGVAQHRLGGGQPGVEAVFVDRHGRSGRFDDQPERGVGDPCVQQGQDVVGLLYLAHRPEQIRQAGDAPLHQLQVVELVGFEAGQDRVGLAGAALPALSPNATRIDLAGTGACSRGASSSRCERLIRGVGALELRVSGRVGLAAHRHADGGSRPSGGRRGRLRYIVADSSRDRPKAAISRCAVCDTSRTGYRSNSRDAK
jgi:hypothetical protein